MNWTSVVVVVEVVAAVVLVDVLLGLSHDEADLKLRQIDLHLLYGGSVHDHADDIYALVQYYSPPGSIIHLTWLWRRSAWSEPISSDESDFINGLIQYGSADRLQFASILLGSVLAPAPACLVLALVDSTAVHLARFRLYCQWIVGGMTTGEFERLVRLFFERYMDSVEAAANVTQQWFWALLLGHCPGPLTRVLAQQASERLSPHDWARMFHPMLVDVLARHSGLATGRIVCRRKGEQFLHWIRRLISRRCSNPEGYFQEAALCCFMSTRLANLDFLRIFVTNIQISDPLSVTVRTMLQSEAVSVSQVLAHVSNSAQFYLDLVQFYRRLVWNSKRSLGFDQRQRFLQVYEALIGHSSCANTALASPNSLTTFNLLDGMAFCENPADMHSDLSVHISQPGSLE